MNQGIRNHFARNNRTQIFSLISFQKEFIGKVFSPKIHQQFVTFNQICFYNFPVIVAIYIDTPDQSICYISRRHIHNDVVPAFL